MDTLQINQFSPIFTYDYDTFIKSTIRIYFFYFIIRAHAVVPGPYKAKVFCKRSHSTLFWAILWKFFVFMNLLMSSSHRDF